MLIPDSEIENIFTPFYRLKETEHQLGSGIGLSLARSLAEFHKGSLNYTQTPEGMNRFILTLPKRTGRLLPADNRKEYGRRHYGKQRRSE